MSPRSSQPAHTGDTLNTTAPPPASGLEEAGEGARVVSGAQPAPHRPYEIVTTHYRRGTVVKLTSSHPLVPFRKFVVGKDRLGRFGVITADSTTDAQGNLIPVATFSTLQAALGYCQRECERIRDQVAGGGHARASS